MKQIFPEKTVFLVLYVLSLVLENYIGHMFICTYASFALTPLRICFNFCFSGILVNNTKLDGPLLQILFMNNVISK